MKYCLNNFISIYRLVGNRNKHRENDSNRITLYLIGKVIEENKKSNDDEYYKGFFAATINFDCTHIYLLFIYFGEGKKS